jgi:hypothetical protein
MSDEPKKPLVPAAHVKRTSILHPEFAYVDSANTDIRARFNRIREQLAQKSSKPVAFKRRTA